MRKWAYRVDDKHGEFRITNCSLKSLKPALAALRALGKGRIEFDGITMSQPLPTLLIENALLNTYRLQDVAAITVQIKEG